MCREAPELADGDDRFGDNPSRAEELGRAQAISVGVGHPDQVRHPITWSRSRLPDPTRPPTLGPHNNDLSPIRQAGGHLQ